MEMGGTLKFYTDRASIRWDLPGAEQLQEVSRRAIAQGRPIYAFLMDYEVTAARQKLVGDWTRIGTLGPNDAISLWRVDPGY
jgi:hypothetical protein